MLFQEAFNLFMLDSEADEIHSQSRNLTVIADRGTQRLYRGNGDNWMAGIEDFQATDWIVVKYEVDGNVVINND